MSADDAVAVTLKVTTDALAWMTPNRRAWLKALTEDEIAANPDAAAELEDAWFARARPGNITEGRAVSAMVRRRSISLDVNANVRKHGASCTMKQVEVAKVEI